MAEYPWLPDELIKLDRRFKIIKTPIGKMMFKNATIADAVQTTGLQEDVLIADSMKQGRKGIVLTCKDQLIPFYQKFDLSASTHGGAVWYQMRLIF